MHFNDKICIVNLLHFFQNISLFKNKYSFMHIRAKIHFSAVIFKNLKKKGVKGVIYIDNFFHKW
jgi:hypothetical protein